MYGLKTKGVGGQVDLAKKRTRFMTISVGISQRLMKQCDRRHRHQQLVNGRARDAARYPQALCEAICQGLIEEMMLQAQGLKSLMSVHTGDGPQEEQLHEEVWP